MCHGHIDAKILMVETEARFRASQSVGAPDAGSVQDTTLPPELMGGVAGVVARATRPLQRLLGWFRGIAQPKTDAERAS